MSLPNLHTDPTLSMRGWRYQLIKPCSRLNQWQTPRDRSPYAGDPEGRADHRRQWPFQRRAPGGYRMGRQAVHDVHAALASLRPEAGYGPLSGEAEVLRPQAVPPNSQTLVIAKSPWRKIRVSRFGMTKPGLIDQRGSRSTARIRKPQSIR